MFGKSADSDHDNDMSPPPIRRPVVAGTWYPGDPEQLAATVDGYLADITPVDGQPLALIVPHAGYVFSGAVAAGGFKQLAGVNYDVAVIIAADHRPPVSKPISVWASGGFETPLGVVPVNRDLAHALIAADSRIRFDPAAHQDEHPIEIELPFLQRVAPGCSIVPVLMGSDDETTVKALADALINTLPNRGVVIIASSDLSHYSQEQDAVRVDEATLTAIEAGSPARLRANIARSMAAGIPNLATCACGLGPILVAMQVSEGLGANMITRLSYANSAASSYGDAERVVGYGAVMFWRYEPPNLTDVQQQQLLALARSAIREYLQSGRLTGYQTDDPLLTRRAGAFVTLYHKGELRGCTGHVAANRPLYEVVKERAVATATTDHRFPPLTLAEMDDLTIEISILSPLRRLSGIEQIEVGRHGLVIVQAGRRGLLLPEVPLRRGWDKETFLEALCFKADLPKGSWREGATLFSFTTVEFGE